MSCIEARSNIIEHHESQHEAVLYCGGEKDRGSHGIGFTFGMDQALSSF
ncbi:hypothetical protein ACVIWU_006766 [Bradyrhizobium sp. USDA 4509]